MKNEEYRKYVEKFLLEDFHHCMFEYRFAVGQNTVPGMWIWHLDKCIQRGFPMMAIKHAREFDFQLAGLSIYDKNGYDHPLEKYISNSKEYKKALMQIKLEEMEEDFK
jgi:hypothetical protein